MDAVNLYTMAASDAEQAGLVWQKAGASTSYGQRIELAAAAGGVAIRDSKDPDGPILLYPRAEFKAFLDGARNGDFDGIGQQFSHRTAIQSSVRRGVSVMFTTVAPDRGGTCGEFEHSQPRRRSMSRGLNHSTLHGITLPGGILTAAVVSPNGRLAIGIATLVITGILIGPLPITSPGLSRTFPIP